MLLPGREHRQQPLTMSAVEAWSVVPDALEEPMTQVQDDSGGDSAPVRNLAVLAADLLERAAAAPAGRAALTLVAGAGAP